MLQGLSSWILFRVLRAGVRPVLCPQDICFLYACHYAAETRSALEYSNIRTTDPTLSFHHSAVYMQFSRRPAPVNVHMYTGMHTYVQCTVCI